VGGFEGGWKSGDEGFERIVLKRSLQKNFDVL
jgi:hypothetical protein